MVRALQTKACDACAMAKRRCGKQAPHCLRCRKRGIQCRYPPVKPTSFVLYDEDDLVPIEPDSSLDRNLGLLEYSTVLPPSRADNIRIHSAIDTPRLSGDFVDDQLATSWFTYPDTWKIHHYPERDLSSYYLVDLNRSVRTVQQWLTRWVEKGSNPFIHSQLYRTRFPRYIQDAYAALTCYVHKTTSNQHFAFQLIEDKLKQLLLDHGIPLTGSLLEPIGTTSHILDPLEHLARVQALLVYQIICLYDGNIRLRHLGERCIPLLHNWMRQMVNNASQSLCLGASMIATAQEQLLSGFTLSDMRNCGNLLWYSWILSESIRRTWLIASGIHAAYSISQAGEPVPCEGGMMFTTRQGIWEAQSAPSWEKLCSEVNVGLMKIADTDRLFSELSPEDVNDFTILILDITFGIERLERWGLQIRD